MHADERRRIRLYRRGNQVPQPILSNQVVAVNGFGASVEKRLLDKALNAAQLVVERAQLIDRFDVVRLGSQIVEHEMRGRERRFRLMDPGFDIFPILRCLPAVSVHPVVCSLRDGTQGIVRDGALQIIGALDHLGQPERPLCVVGTRSKVVVERTLAHPICGERERQAQARDDGNEHDDRKPRARNSEDECRERDRRNDKRNGGQAGAEITEQLHSIRLHRVSAAAMRGQIIFDADLRERRP